MSAQIGYDLTRAYTSQDITDGRGFGLGDLFTDHAGNMYVYAQASNSITQYDAVAIDESFSARQLVLDTNAKTALFVAIAQAALADGNKGWFMKHGVTSVRTLADCDADVPLYATSTPGALDDAATSQMIQGLRATTSNSGSTAAIACIADFPSIRAGATL